MTKKKIAPYGSWKSPITTDLVTANAIRIDEIICEQDFIYWLEFRANQSGRQVIVRLTRDGNIADITPPEYNVRNRVHEYGGASYQVFNGVIYFSNFEDQRLYRQVPGSEPFPLTPDNHDRYADFALDDRHHRLICIRENHAENEQEVINSVVAISLTGTSPIEILITGNDFYSNPRISPDGSLLCWLTWNHPNMPWDGCELWVGSFDESGNIFNVHCIAGGQNESV
ncbi:MAG: S9 family peptidase, partial [Chloroflexota bacterium]